MNSVNLILNVLNLTNLNVKYWLVYCQFLALTTGVDSSLSLVAGTSLVEGALFLWFQALLNFVTLAIIKVVPYLKGSYDCRRATMYTRL